MDEHIVNDLRMSPIACDVALYVKKMKIDRQMETLDRMWLTLLVLKHQNL